MVQLAARLILIQKVPRSSRGGASIFRRGTQAVYETGLENQRGWKSSVGSNPTLSAIIKSAKEKNLALFLFWGLTFSTFRGIVIL